MERREAIPALTGARGLFASSIVLWHAVQILVLVAPKLLVFRIALAGTPLGVDAFFILSGFILAHQYGGRLETARAYLRFVWLRLSRIYPLYLATMLATGFAAFVAARSGSPFVSDASFTPRLFVENLFMIQSWGLPAHPSWNAVAWSVSCEWLVYLLAPLAFALVAWRKSPVVHLAAAGILLAAPAVFHALYSGVPYYAVGVARVVPEFVAGVILFRLWLDGKGRAPSWRRLAPAMLAASLVIGAVAVAAGVTMLVAVPFIAAGIFGLAVDARAPWLSGRRMIALGEASYSLYMTHVLVMTAGLLVVPATLQGTWPATWRVLFLLSLTALTIPVAFACYHLFEVPARRWLRWLPTRARPSRSVTPSGDAGGGGATHGEEA